MTERLIYKNIFEADNIILTLSVEFRNTLVNSVCYLFYKFSLLYLNNSPIVIVSCYSSFLLLLAIKKSV